MTDISIKQNETEQNGKKNTPQLWHCFHVPTNTADPIFYIKQLFQLQINVILNQAIILITKAGYLVLFFYIYLDM